MAETNEKPEAPESSGGDQKEPPVSPPQPVNTDQPEVAKDARNMAMLCHLLAIFTGFLGPLIIWLIKKEDAPFVDRQGKEALNFQFTVLIGHVASFLLTFVCIGFFLWLAVIILNLVFCIIAAVKSSRGEEYRYPLAIRFIR